MPRPTLLGLSLANSNPAALSWLAGRPAGGPTQGSSTAPPAPFLPPEPLAHQQAHLDPQETLQGKERQAFGLLVLPLGSRVPPLFGAGLHVLGRWERSKRLLLVSLQHRSVAGGCRVSCHAGCSRDSLPSRKQWASWVTGVVSGCQGFPFPTLLGLLISHPAACCGLLAEAPDCIQNFWWS